MDGSNLRLSGPCSVTLENCASRGVAHGEIELHISTDIGPGTCRFAIRARDFWGAESIREVSIPVLAP